MINRIPPTHTTDTWLTPQNIIEALGPFDYDPCCPEDMPYVTAPIMITPAIDGLAATWSGFVWCNPPFSNILPWIAKMQEHGNGIMLTPAKSTDTKWGQQLLNTCDCVLFQKGRLLFNYIDGTPSVGKWSPYMFTAFGSLAVASLHSAITTGKLEGVLLMRSTQL